MNNDSYLDIVVANLGTSSVGILLGNSNGNFAPMMTYFLQESSLVFSVVLGDFNSDNQLDMAVTITNTGNICIFLGFGNGSFSTQKIYSAGLTCFPSYMIVDFFNDDDHADVSVICLGDSAVIILFGIGDGGFLIGRKYLTSANSIVKSIAHGDFNNDTYLDIVVTNIPNNNIDIFYRNGAEPFAVPVTISTGLNSEPQYVAVGDFNNDNQSDIVVANYGTDTIGILLADEISYFSSLTIYSTGNHSQPCAVVIGDVNDDNYLDIIAANSGTNDITIFHGYGNGSFVAIKSYSTGTSSRPYSMAVSDFNNDKQMDIVIANSGTNNILLLFGFGNGTFGNESSYSMSYNSDPYSLAVGDFNNDSWMDIAVANYGADCRNSFK